MSTEIVKEIICPDCGEAQSYRMYASINARENPELKEKILLETLFDWRCRRCNYFAAMAYPLLYTDPVAGYVISAAPLLSHEDAPEPTEELRDYVKRSVKNLAELKEKILIFDAGLDDVAVELVKNALCDIIKNSYHVSRVHAYFCRVNEREGEIEFAIFLPKKTDPVYHTTKLDVYRQSEEVLRALDFVDPEGFLRVDAKLARQIIQQYQDI